MVGSWTHDDSAVSEFGLRPGTTPTPTTTPATKTDAHERRPLAVWQKNRKPGSVSFSGCVISRGHGYIRASYVARNYVHTWE